MTYLRPEFSGVEVKTNARLHMGFLDLNGELGRQFGSIGVGLDGLYTRLRVIDNGKADSTPLITASGPDSERAQVYAHKICQLAGVAHHLNIDISESIIPHSGLGSGTQLALAVGYAISEQFSLGLSAHDIAGILGRGKRSSIGINTFKNGGFHIDCGTSTGNIAPPVFFSREFPSQWRFILLFDHGHRGLHGEKETNAFTQLTPLSRADAGTLCRLALMQLIPAVIEENVLLFGEAVTQIQAIVGDHFAPVQGGRFVSPGVREKLSWYSENGAAGFGQSSWGPTGFVLCENEDTARGLVRNSVNALPHNSCEELIVGAVNHPAEVIVKQSI